MNKQITPRVSEIDFKWVGIEKFIPTAKAWGDILYKERRFIDQSDGIDFYTNYDLDLCDSKDMMTITRWGKDPETSFYCVTGNGLYTVLPWWKTMQDFFTQRLCLTPWLPYPCLLYSQSNLRRHVDLGRPTAFNYPLFGEDLCTNHVWHTEGAPADEYDETYKYTFGKTIVLDTSYEHGGFVNPGKDSSDVRAICNMGFREPYEICLERISEAQKHGILDELYK